jgi:multidrug efflux pump subunit AcrB
MRKTWNTTRFFAEKRHVSWVLFVAVLLWGVYGYSKMPKRKDPDIPVRVAVGVCPWPGAGAEKLESLVTRRIEEEVSRNSKVTKIQSLSRIGVSIVYVELDERIDDPAREFEDIKSRLDGVKDLPPGAGPIQFLKDFGDTAALMLTVASPKAAEVEVSLRARAVQASIASVRAGAGPNQQSGRTAIVISFPRSIDPEMFRRDLPWYVRRIEQSHLARDVRPIYGPGFAGVDVIPASSEAALAASLRQLFGSQRLTSFHPDVWGPAIIHDPGTTRDRLAAVAGDKYTFRELDDFTELIRKRLQTVPEVAKIDRAGVLKERIFLEYSQERLASHVDEQLPIDQILAARNITFPGGILDVDGRNITIDPTGEFKNEAEIGETVIAATPSGSPVYLRDGFDLIRGYESPAEFLNYYLWPGPDGKWNRSRAVTLAVQMRPGEQIGNFGKAVDAALSSMRERLPDDLVIARTSDQPLLVNESVGLFMKSLYEAIALVVLVALVGFWEWRSALLMALAIPITLAMTFGMMHALGVDLQQISIASLILALGLLVDDPVVAGDAIKRELEAGRPRILAAWRGPTKLARAILFATITNIVAYLPFLVLPGDMGRFIYALPVVLTCSLIASRIVSMTFIPLLGYCLLRHDGSPVSAEDVRKRRVAGLYYKIGTLLIQNRFKALAVSMTVIVTGAFFASQIKDSFFPKDYSYLSYVDVWLPEDAPLSSTDQTAAEAEAVIREVAAKTVGGRSKGRAQPEDLLKSLTTFVGGGGPRFWFSANPEQEQLNYAQILIQVQDKRDTSELAERLQKELSARVPGARLDVRQLESGDPVGIPVAVRISGPDIRTLLNLSEQVKEIYRSVPQTDRIRDDWGAGSFSIVMQVDPDRANLAGFSNLDIARSSAAAMSGYPVAVLRDGDTLIPVVARLRLEERMQLSDIGNLYVNSLESGRKVPLGQVSTLQYQMRTEKILRRNRFRTITVSCFPAPGVLASEVMDAVRPQLSTFQRSLPSGYSLEIGGEEEAQVKDFSRMTVVLAISVLAIFLALVFQFRNALKPMIVFAMIPYGVAGAFAALYLSGLPFGFMAFLGIISLIGVIVSHVIVLFEFIEELREQGVPLQEALLNAGIIRLRPVLITVGATIFALFPLATNGGPLWEPLCYAQIGGLAVATFVTLLLVPVLYSILVLDLGWIKWAPSRQGSDEI